MKIFISWSKADSRDIAQVLKTFVKNSFDTVEVFLSFQDLTPGKPWLPKLFAELKTTKFAILCVTRENLNSPWLNFEGGAVSKALDNTWVCPLLIGIDALPDGHPLSAFQLVRLHDKESFWGLIVSMAKVSKSKKSSTAPSLETLKNRFEKFYPELLQELTKFGKAQKKSSLFISVPMAAVESNEAYKKQRDVIIRSVSILESTGLFNRIETPVKDIESKDHFDDPEGTARYAIDAIVKCDDFLCVYPDPVLSSVLVELGCALALNKNCVLLTRDRQKLPYILREGHLSLHNLKIYDQVDPEQLPNFLKEKKASLFDFRKAVP